MTQLMSIKWARPSFLLAGTTLLGHARAVVQLLLQQVCHDARDRAIMWLYIPPFYPPFSILLEKELSFWLYARDAGCISWEWLYWLGQSVIALPETLPYHVLITKEEEW